MNLKLIIVGLTMSLALVSLIPNGQNAEPHYRQMYELQKVSEKKARSDNCKNFPSATEK